MRYPIARLGVFGSVMRGEDGLESDLDLLVEFEPEAAVGFFAMAAMELELEEALGLKVDLRTPSELSRYFREDVVRTAETVYAA